MWLEFSLGANLGSEEERGSRLSRCLCCADFLVRFWCASEAMEIDSPPESTASTLSPRDRIVQVCLDWDCWEVSDFGDSNLCF